MKIQAFKAMADYKIFQRCQKAYFQKECPVSHCLGVGEEGKTVGGS